MSFISRDQRMRGPEAVAAHPTFQVPWVKRMLDDPDREWDRKIPMIYTSNTMFEETLSGKTDCILAHLSFHRPCKELDAIQGEEGCWLLSLGPGVDGATHRSHGGFNGLVLDQISGMMAHSVHPRTIPPATATLTVDFKAEVRTPCVVLLRAWVTAMNGRKIWVRSVLEDSNGRACTTCKGLFVYPKDVDAKL